MDLSKLQALSDKILNADPAIFNDVKDDILEMQENIPFLNGVSLKEQAGITDHEMLQLHATACTFFEKGKLNEAELFFRQLCVMDPMNIDYILGLAAVFQRKKLYSVAVDTYSIAHMLQKNTDSRPVFYCGQCLFFDRKYDKAKICFEIVIRDNHTPELVPMAQLFIEAIEKGKEKVAGVSDE